MSDPVVTLTIRGDTGQMVGQVKIAKSALTDLGPAAEQAGEQTSRGLTKGTEAARIYGAAMQAATGMLKQLALGAAAAVGIGGLSAMMAASVGNAKAFGQAMAEVSTVAGDTANMDALTRSVRSLSQEYGQAPAAQAKALYEIISAGISDTARATETLEAANRLALGGITEVETAADGLTTVLNAYGAAAGSAAEVSDRLFVAALAGKTTIGELSATIGNAAPIAAQTGVSIDELLASVAALTLGGVKTSTAVDGIRATIAAIIKPSQEATAMAASLGLQFDAAALKSQGLAGFLDNVAQATGGSAEQLAVLFGGVEALAPVMALTGNQAKAFAGTLESMADSAGVTDTAVAKMSNTAEFQFARLKSVVGDSLLSVGESLLSVVVPATTAVVDNWDTLTDVAGSLATALVVLAGARGIAAVVTALQALRAEMAATALWASWTSGATSAALAADKFGSRLVALAGGPIVAAVGGLALLAIEVKKNWDAIIKAEQRGATSIAMARGSIGTGLSDTRRPLAALETDVQRLADLMQRDSGREQALARHQAALEKLELQYRRSGGTVAQWNALLDESTAEAVAAQKASTAQGAALKRIEELASDAGLASAKLAEANREHAAALAVLAAEEAKGGAAAQRAAQVRMELNAQHAKTVADLTGASKAAEPATRALAKAEDDRTEGLRRLIEQQNRAADNEYMDSLMRAEDAAISADRMIAGLRDEADQAGMTQQELRRLAETRAFDAAMKDAQIARTPQHLADMRAEFEAAQRVRDVSEQAAREQFALAEEARRAAEESARAWEDFAYGLADAVLEGGGAVRDYFKRLWDDLKREMLASGFLTLFRSLFNIGGGAGGGAGSLLGAMFGSGGAGSGAGLFGNLLGGGGNNAGALGSMLFGGGSGFTGLMNLFRGGTISSSMGIQQVNAITGAQGASGGAGSILGGGMLQNGFSMGGMMGAGGGIMMGLQGIRTGNALQGAAGGAMAGMSIGGPWGALIGGIIGGLGALIRGNKPPDFRVGGTQASVRNPEGGFETVFGRVRAGSREISWESLVQPMQQFDQAIADMVQSFGMGQQQMDSIRDALARWSVDLKGDAATAEGVLGSRFGAILSTFSQDVQTFVGNTGTVQERVGRLADALAIEDIVDVGALGDSFADVSALLGEYRQGTEAITDTYARVLGSVTLLDQALALSGTTLDMTRGELIRFAADITDAAGGLERAQQLWGGYYATFYTETERAQVQLAQATERASALFAAANLDLAQYTGDGGAAAFRDMFERLLPTLSAEAVVQYLEMAEALGIVIDLTGQASGSVSEFSGTLADLMADVTGQLAEFAPQQSWAQQLAAINTETEALITRATELGATEEQLATIRELGAARVADVLAQQADAYRQYADLVRGLSDEAADLRGLTEYQREMREIDRWTRQTADALNAAARAAGMQAAAEEDLALMHEVAAARAAAAMARLAQRGRDIVAQLAGSRLTQIDQQVGEVGTAVGTWMSQAAGGMDQVTQATDNAVQALIGAQQRVRDWLNGIMSSELSGLRPRDRLTELLALAERTRVAAAGGDAEAMARMPQLADEILRLGRDVYASGSQYFELRDMVRGWMQGLADIVIPTPEPGTGGGGGGGGGGFGGGVVGDTLEQQQEASAQAAAERRALWMELVAVIRDMMSAPDQTLQGIEETLGFSMRDLVTELGVSLTDMTVATASQLAGIAQAMGVELTDLASHVGVSLGSLGDRQSLLNDALESTIATLPAGQRDLLEPLLRDVEDAAALGDTAGVEAGIESMEDAIAEMDTDIRDALAPFFTRIAPADPATELSHLASLDTTLGSSLSELQAQTLHLAAIEGLLNGGGGLPLQPTGPLTPGGGFGGGGVPPPGYAVGTAYVPADGLAYLHRGEMVWPAAVSDFFRREGIPISAPPRAFATRSNDGGDQAVTGLLRDIAVTARESQAELRALRERVAQLESTIAAGDDRKIRAMDRQTDEMRGRK